MFDYLGLPVRFVMSYYKFFLSLIAVLLMIGVSVWYFGDVMVGERNYEIIIENPDQEVILNSEEVQLQELQQPQFTTTEVSTQDFVIKVINTSQIPGHAADVAYKLEQNGFEVASVSSDTERTDKTSIVVYDPAFQEQAVAVSKLIGGALPTAANMDNINSEKLLTIYVGQNYQGTDD